MWNKQFAFDFSCADASFSGGTFRLSNTQQKDNLAILVNNCVGVLIAFWDNHSPGTKNMITLAREKGMMVFIKDITQYKEVA